MKDIRALTSIRGIAAWWIVFFHFNEFLPATSGNIAQNVFSRGYLAVDLFFELSGFIIALNYAEQFRRPSAAGMLRFWGVRLARIYPLHIFMLGVFVLNPIAVILFASHPAASVRYDPIYLLLSAGLVQNWGLTSYLAWNVPAWSISTEWLAYLLFPFLAWLLFRVIRNRLHAVALAVGLLVLLALGFAVSSGGLGQDIPHTGAFRCVAEFGIGVALYHFWKRQPADSKYETRIALFAAGIILTTFGLFAFPDFLLVPAGFLMLIYGLTDGRSVVARFLSASPLHFLGTISYSTYLVHFFMKDWVKFLLVKDGISPVVWSTAYVLSTAAASVFLYYCIERPGRRVGRAWIDRSAVPLSRFRLAFR